MTSIRIGKLSLATLLAPWLLLAASGAGAVTINDTGTPGYVTGAAAYTGVAKILFNSNGYICTGSAISTNLVLTAGHCVDDYSDGFGGAIFSDHRVTFETASGSTVYDTVNQWIHPWYQERAALCCGLPEFDLAVLRLDGTTPLDAQIYDIDYDATLMVDAIINGLSVDLVGYGLGGNPAVGHLPTGVRRHATNLIDGVYGGEPDFPFAMFNTFDGDDVGDGEGLINGGDSGGPALLGNTILGVASFANLPRPPDAFAAGEYLTGHIPFAHVETGDWIRELIRANDPTPVPEPAMSLLLLAGLWFARARRR